MAKPLRDVAPKAPKEGEFTGVKKSKTEPADISDFNASSGNQDFAKKHKIEKHEYPHGDEAFTPKNKQTDMTKHGYKKPADEKVYESMKCESCGKAYESESCGCSGETVKSAVPGKGKGMIADKKKLDEVLTKKTPASDVISDFVHSKNKMFSGDSKKQRIKRALGAYYNMHKEETEQLDEMPSQNRSAAGSGKNTNPNLSRLARKLSMEKPRYFRPKDKMSKAEERAEAEKLTADKEAKRYPPGKAKGVKEEAEQIDELSNKTLAGYVQGATRDALKNQYALGKGEKVDTRRLMNRRKGIDKAVDKMANEELAMPMLEGGKKKEKKESAPGDTPMRFPSGNVGDTDTGRV